MAEAEKDERFETEISFCFHLPDGVENEFTFPLDTDLFFLILGVQLWRNQTCADAGREDASSA